MREPWEELYDDFSEDNPLEDVPPDPSLDELPEKDTRKLGIIAGHLESLRAELKLLLIELDDIYAQFEVKNE